MLTIPGENICEEAKCETDPTYMYQGSSGTVCEDSDLPKMLHIGPVIATSYHIAFVNQLGMEKTRMVCMNQTG